MKLVQTISFLLLSYSLFAQQPPQLSKAKNHTERIQLWANYCDEFLNLENYTQLRIAGRKGIRMTSATEYVNRSLFYFYIGISFDYSTEADSASYYLEKSEKYARKATHPKRRLEALKQLCIVYDNYGNKSKREHILAIFQTILDTTHNQEIQQDLYQHLGDYYTNIGSYEKGLQYLLKGVKIRRQILPKSGSTDSINFGVQLIKVAELYLGLTNRKKALDYLKESEIYIQQYNDAITHVKNDFISIYLLENDFPNAIKSYQELERFLKRASCTSCWTILIESDLSFADYYCEQKNYKKALQAANHAKKMAPLYADEFLSAQIDYTYGTIYLALKEYQKALAYFKAAEPFTAEDDPEVNSWLQRSLAETYAGLNNWKMAYKYHQTYVHLQDKLLNEKAKRNLAEVEGLYQNEKKQAQINELSTKNTINDLTIKNTNRQLLFLIIGFIFVVVIGTLVYVQSKNRKKNNKRLEELNRELEQANAIKLRFFSILNHDLRSPIANLIHFLHLQQNDPALLDTVGKEALQNSTLAGAEHLLSTMEDMLLWSKGQMEKFEPVSTHLSIQSLFDDLTGYFHAESHVKILVEMEKQLFLTTDENYLKTILRNLTSNAIKALEKTEDPIITWRAVQQESNILLIISDNGPGASQTAFKALYDENEVVGIKTGLGLHLIRDLAKSIHCSIEVNTAENGATITLTFNVSSL